MSKDIGRDLQSEYLVQAEQLITLAKSLEGRGDLHNAVESYKKLISTLLNGVQADSDKNRRAAVQQRLPMYINYAEHLSKLANKTQKDNPKSQNKANPTRCDPTELKFYRVLKWFDNSRCLLVQDSRSGKQHVVKILRKADDASLFTLVQTNMVVRPQFYIEMADSVYLFLEHAMHGNVNAVLRRHGMSQNKKPSELCDKDQSNIPPGTQKVRRPSAKTGKVRRCSSSADLKAECLRAAAETDADSTLKCERSSSTKSDADAEAESSREVLPPSQLQSQRSTSRSSRVPENVYSGRRCAPQAITLAKTESGLQRPLSTVQSSSVAANHDGRTDGESHFAALLERVRDEFGLNSLFFHVKSPFRSASGDSAADDYSEGGNRHLSAGSEDGMTDPLGIASFQMPAPFVMQSPSAVSQAEFEFLSLAERGSEDLVRLWAAELILAVDNLHRSGIVLRDLHLENVLVRADGHLLLSYFDTSYRVCAACRRSITSSSASNGSPKQNLLGTLVTRSGSANAILSGSGAGAGAAQRGATRCCCYATAAFSDAALRRGNIAPELLTMGACSEPESSSFSSPRRASSTLPSSSTAFGACDWWSVGSLIFELSTGITVRQAYPYGFTATSQFTVPPYLSAELQSLLRALLVVAAHQRLGCGVLGADEIQMHSFFAPIDWHRVVTFYSPPATTKVAIQG